jgi:hypothetical protein
MIVCDLRSDGGVGSVVVDRVTDDATPIKGESQNEGGLENWKTGEM